MRPWYASRAAQLTVPGSPRWSIRWPSRAAWALQMLLDAPDREPPEPPAAPEWVHRHVPWLARFWGDGLDKAKRLTLNQAILDWSRDDPEGLLAAARVLASRRPAPADQKAQRLLALLTTEANPKGLQVRTLHDRKAARDPPGGPGRGRADAASPTGKPSSR